MAEVVFNCKSAAKADVSACSSCDAYARQMGTDRDGAGISDFWQKEAHRYDGLSRAIVSRVRTEIALGMTTLNLALGLVIVNELFFFLPLIPLLAAAIWGLVAWSSQESFCLDAHLMYAERMLARELETRFEARYAPWADFGGKHARFGMVLPVAMVLWGLTTLGVLVATNYLARAWVAEPMLWNTVLASSILAGIVSASVMWRADRTGSKLFERLEAQLAETGLLHE